MSDLISRQRAIASAISGMIRTIQTREGGEDWIRVKEVRESLMGLPPIDAVPVVRCKDCKHNYSKKHNKRYNHEDIVCDYFETDGLNDDDFCSYGERSEE